MSLKTPFFTQLGDGKTKNKNLQIFFPAYHELEYRDVYKHTSIQSVFFATKQSEMNQDALSLPPPLPSLSLSLPLSLSTHALHRAIPSGVMTTQSHLKCARWSPVRLNPSIQAYKFTPSLKLPDLQIRQNSKHKSTKLRATWPTSDGSHNLKMDYKQVIPGVWPI